MIIADAMLWEI